MDKLMGALSLCRKAGKLVGGRDAAEKACARGECKLVLLASDLAPRSNAQARRFCERTLTKCKPVAYDMQSLSAILGGKPFGIVAICDENFARMIESRLSEAVSPPIETP